jgi:hypothetical protein
LDLLINENMKAIDEGIRTKVEFLCSGRLKNAVTPIEVLNWFSNFDEKEIPKALKVLEFLEVFTEKELVELWEDRLNKLCENAAKSSEIYIMPIGDYGKSGTLMVYYLKKAPSFSRIKQKVVFIEKPEALEYAKEKHLLKMNSTFVLLDDFIGSGESIVNFYKKHVQPKLEAMGEVANFGILSLFSIKKGTEHIMEEISPDFLVSEIKIPVFSSRNSVFGYRKYMIQIREFCYSHGINLFEIKDRKTQEVRLHPLGYEDSQALICFPYTTPNNTLPIIWSSKNNWRPLFPRFSDQRISDAKKVRKEMAHELSLYKSSPIISRYFYSGMKLLPWRVDSYFTRVDFTKFSTIKMVKSGRSIPYICQCLGLTEADFHEITKELIEDDIFNDNLTFTNFGNRLYLEIINQEGKIKRKISFERKELTFHEVKYLPKTFNGKS